VAADHRALAGRLRAVRSPILDEEDVQPVVVEQRIGQLRLAQIGTADGRDRRPQQAVAADRLADTLDESGVVPGRTARIERRMMHDQELLAERQARQRRRQLGEDLRVLEQPEARLDGVLGHQLRVTAIDGRLDERMDGPVALENGRAHRHEPDAITALAERADLMRDA
jgi:hypothetical protein